MSVRGSSQDPLAGGLQQGIDPSVFASTSSAMMGKQEHAKEGRDTMMEDINEEQPERDNKREPSSGPVRSKMGNDASSSSNAGEGSSKGPVAAPVKAACTFCRSRKSRCNGKQPCAACLTRSQPDDCHYTISRRGGKPKPKTAKSEPIETHLEKILDLSDLPHLVRIPNAVPQLQGFMMENGSGGDGASTSMLPGQQQNHFTPSHAMSPTAFSATSRARSESLHLDNKNISIRGLLEDYYNLFYRFIPILPSPAYLDVLASTIPPDSPFLLSLQCVLPVLRNEPLVPVPSLTEEEKKAHIRTQSAYFAKKTEAAIDAVLERVESRPEEEDYHTLEVVQALCMLIIYEYGGGRALKARLKADTALGIAMSKGLHRLSASTGNNGIKSPLLARADSPHYLSTIDAEEMYEVRKRMWWSLWSMTMWTAYNTGRIPTIRADDARITSELPKCKDDKAWAFVVSSLQGLLLIQDRVLALSTIEHGRAQGDTFTSQDALPGLPFQGSSARTKASDTGTNDQGVPKSFSGHPTMASRADILQSMLDIDQALQDQMQRLEQSTTGIISTSPHSQQDDISQNGATHDETRYLHFVWAIQLYTASLTLHVGQAFQGATLFERKLCFLSSISESNDAAACQIPMPNAFSDDDGSNSAFSSAQPPLAVLPEMDLYARGPFLPKDSLKRCVDASDKLLAISRNLRSFKGPFAAPNNPFNACSFVLISFVCLMQALAISTNVLDEDQCNAMGSSFEASGGNAPSLLRSAQGAAALTMPPSSSSQSYSTASVRQQQLQSIWARVKEAKGTLQELSRHWDMVIPMAEEVGGCLEASQFLLSQDSSSSAAALSFPNGGL